MGKYGTSFIKRSQVCQGSVRTHKRINYLTVSVHGQGKKALVRGNDRPGTDVINYHRGASRRQGLVSTHALTQQDVFSCVQTVIGNLDRKSELPFLTQSLPDKTGGNALFSLKTWYHTGKTWLVIYHTCHTGKKRDASLSPVSTLYCLGNEDRWGEVQALFKNSHP